MYLEGWSVMVVLTCENYSFLLPIKKGFLVKIESVKISQSAKWVHMKLEDSLYLHFSLLPKKMQILPANLTGVTVIFSGNNLHPLGK